MSTATVEPVKAATPPPAAPAKHLVEIALDQIEPSPYNRKRFDQKALEELAANIIGTDGVIEPVILRPVDKGVIRYQLVAGERRWLASKIGLAKLGSDRKTITSIVKNLTDAQAIEVTLAENIQREDVHVLELSRTYKALLTQTNEATGKLYTREDIAGKVKKSYSDVCVIIQTENLIEPIKKACYEGKINSSLAKEICKYQSNEQEKIFLECFVDEWGEPEFDSAREVVKSKDAESTMSVRKLRDWIANNIHIDLSKAPFDTKDAYLLKGVGPCTTCPKRTGSNPGLFAEEQELKRGDLCTDPSCYDAKKEALVQIKIAEAQRQAAPAPAKQETPKPQDNEKPIKTMGPTYSQTAALAQKKTEQPPAAPVVEIQKISTLENYELRDGQKKKDVLYLGDYNLAKPGCKKEKKAIYVDGPKIGQFAYLCDVKNCSNHAGERHSGMSRPPVTFERKMEIWRGKVQFVYRDEMLKTILARLPGSLGEFEAQLVSSHILRTLPHRDSEKIARVYGLREDADLKPYAKGLKGAELLRFIVVCSLVEHLGLEGTCWGGALPHNVTLANAAKHYKVDGEALLESAKAAMEKKRPKSQQEKEAAAKAAAAPTVAKPKKENALVRASKKRAAVRKKAKDKK